MSILNLFLQMLTNAQRRKPAPWLAFRPFLLIFRCFKCSQMLTKLANRISQVLPHSKTISARRFSGEIQGIAHNSNHPNFLWRVTLHSLNNRTRKFITGGYFKQRFFTRPHCRAPCFLDTPKQRRIKLGCGLRSCFSPFQKNSKVS